jgi:hypothetical protein
VGNNFRQTGRVLGWRLRQLSEVRDIVDKVRLALNLLISPTSIAGSSFGPGEKAKKACFSRAERVRSA